MKKPDAHGSMENSHRCGIRSSRSSALQPLGGGVLSATTDQGLCGSFDRARPGQKLLEKPAKKTPLSDYLIGELSHARSRSVYRAAELKPLLGVGCSMV